ncbi:phage holin family protein [Nonomuraea sp. NPDC048826]|uniref:phage holin family protein n=1 Tax=Nonomuraea sp. NPDC048826 TaxID=3364347 RepID=UPI00371FA857
MPQTPEEESLGSLVAQATDHISTLVRSEIELAKSEFRFDAKRVGTAVGAFAAAAFAAHLCLILASFTFAFVLAQWLPTWAAFLIVTVVYLAAAGLAVFFGVRKLKGLAKMKRTGRSLKGLKEIAHPDEPELQVGDGRPSPVKRPVASDGA